MTSPSRDQRTSQGRLTGKRALVTAAAAGIGRASALAMAAEGAAVLATDIDEDGLALLAADADGALSSAVLDVCRRDEVMSVVDEAQPDILLNCAGFVHHGSLLDATDEEWETAFTLNVRSMFHTIQAALPGMIERGSGSIINVASIASSLKGVGMRCVYGASKAAVIGLTKSVAIDFIKDGIRCNAICPGTVQSPSLEDRLHATGNYEAAREQFIARQPMGRLGTPEEMASLAVYLGSDESRFASGQAFIVDGGMAI